MNDKKIEDWIHGKLVVETDERDIIIRIEPVEGGPTPTGEVIRLKPTGAQIKHMRGDGKPVGPRKLALELGLRRGLKLAKIVGVTTLSVAGAAVLFKGVPVLAALKGAALVAAGSAIAGGTEKSLKEYRKQQGDGLSMWQILGGIIIEILKLVCELISKEKKK